MKFTTRINRYSAVFPASILAVILFLVVQRVWRGPSGFDVYYYALQTRAMSLGGPLFFDQSLVYGVLALLDRMVRNPVLSSQILSALSMGSIYGCLLVISFRRGPSLYKSAVAGIAVFNPAIFYQTLEFTKNNFSLAFFFIAYAALTGEGGRCGLPKRTAPSLFRFIAGLGCLAVSVLSHRMMLVVAGLFAAQALAVLPGVCRFARRGAGQRLPGRILLCCGLVLGAALVTGLALLKTGLLDRLGVFSLAAPLDRLRQLGGTRPLPGEKIFYIILQILPVFLVPCLVVKKRLLGRSEAVFGLLAFLFVFPFLEFSWDGTGFRLLLLEPLMLAPLLLAAGEPVMPLGVITAGSAAGGNTGRPLGAAIAALFIAGSVLFTAESALRLAPSKGPDYRRLAGEFASIETLARGRRLIAHRGLAGFLWYEKGIWAENFIPSGENGRYLRVVYAFTPEIFEPYLEEGDTLPVRISRSYTLIEEYLWQRFYREKRDLRFLRSELNPCLPRPVSSFAINREIARRMSPVSE
ncbi:MAG: hypothetical protein LBI85_03320 [Spirochaetaceae bacterium]|nr:hypothetical protein [Spirochaetaceae bacterium]